MKITFAAIVNGETIGTRTSGTMPYTHALVAPADADSSAGVVSWHLSHDGAVKASRAKVRGEDRLVWPGAVIVDAVPVKASGVFMASKYATADDAAAWKPLYEAASTYSAAKLGSDRDAALADAAVEVATDKASNAEAIAARLNAEADAAKQAANLDAAEAILAEGVPTADGGLILAPAGDVVVTEPIVAVTADGDAVPAEGRPLHDKHTREAVAACAAVGLTYWSGHPRSGFVWAVDSAQAAHPVHVDRKHGTAAIGDYELSLSSTPVKKVIGDSPYVPWSIDGQPDGEDVTLADVIDAAGDRVIVAHIGSGPVVDAVAAQAPTADVEPIVAQGDAEPVATETPALGVNARKVLLADMVRDTLDKMVAGLTAEQLAELGMADGDAVTGQVKMWLRRSGRALIYGDGAGVKGNAD